MQGRIRPELWIRLAVSCLLVGAIYCSPIRVPAWGKVPPRFLHWNFSTYPVRPIQADVQQTPTWSSKPIVGLDEGDSEDDIEADRHGRFVSLTAAAASSRTATLLSRLCSSPPRAVPPL